MTAKYYAILTNLGAGKLANAAALGTQLQITHMALGDGGGVLPTPNASQTALIGEKRRAQLNSLSIDSVNASQIIAEQVIPENEGGWWIREIGLFDVDGVLIAVANCPETYKPQLQEGSGRTQTVRMILIVNSTDAVTVKIDPSVVLATRKYVDEATLTVSQYTEKLMTDHAGAANPHKQYLQIANALSEIKDVGKIAEVLTNLGLGNGSALPVGVPLPWSLAVAPDGWLKCNGASFSATAYPVLAKAYPALNLPDLRGEFIRGWDDARGVDSGRTLLSAQADLFKAHNHQAPTAGSSRPGSGIYEVPGSASGDQYSDFDYGYAAPTSSMGGAETRPRNVAFNYIVRAA